MRRRGESLYQTIDGELFKNCCLCLAWLPIDCFSPKWRTDNSPKRRQGMCKDCVPGYYAAWKVALA